MGKLKDLVKEETSLANSIKYNSRRLRLASLGLISKVEAERERVFAQLMKAGQGAGDESTLLGVINILGVGAVRLARDESRRVFEELVELGEQASTPPTVEEVIQKAKTAAAAVTQPARKAVEAVSKVAEAKPVPTAVKAKAVAENAGDELQRALATLKKLDGSIDHRAQLEALVLQAQEGDVKGRRPAATKADDRALFDARKELKGMDADTALQLFFSQVKKLKKGVPA
jgi:diazepam-binding inhibitor (GABA receptor modulating acyl-CoA-binding protein)